MSKTLKIFIAMAVAMAVAAPAMAEIKLNGYYRLQAIGENTALAADEDTVAGIDQRLRMKLTNKLNDNVKVVYYGEVDTPWGQPSKGGVGGGGQLGADGVNIETKNAYLDLKMGDWGVRTGVQGVASSFDGMLFFNDMTAAKVTGKLGALGVTGVYSKWFENTRTDWDDSDLWALMLSHAYNDSFKVGADVYFNDDNANDVEDLYYGVHADVRTGNLGLDGFALYRDYSDDAANQDGDALVLTAKANMVLPQTGDVGLRLIYFTDDDDAADRNTFDSASGAFEFYNENLMLFLTDISYNNFSGGRRALTDAAYAGYGLWAAVLSGNFNLPNDMYAKAGIGYFSALEDATNGAAADRAGETLGTEVALKIGKKVLGNVDISLRGAYAALDDFYDGQAAGQDPEDLYKVVGMMNVSF